MVVVVSAFGTRRLVLVVTLGESLKTGAWGSKSAGGGGKASGGSDSGLS